MIWRGFHAPAAWILAIAVGGMPLAGVGAKNPEDERSRGEPAQQVKTPPAGLTPRQERALRAAVQRGDTVAVESIVFAAIARSPDQASRIVEDAVRIAPKHAQAILGAVQSVFPALEERARAAAKRALESLGEEKPAAPAVPPSGKTETPAEGAEALTEIREREHQWSGKISVGGAYRTGVSRSLDANLGAEVRHEIGKWRNTLNVTLDYNKNEGKAYTHRFRTRGKTRRSLNHRLYAFGLLDYENNRFSGFEYQLTESVGLGYRIIDADSFTWDLEAGPSWRQSRITETGELADDLFLRGGSEITWNISDTAKFTNETSVLYNGDQVELESSAGVDFQEGDELSNISALDMTVIGNLTARISTEVRYTSKPPPGGAGTETVSKFSLIHNF